MTWRPRAGVRLLSDSARTADPPQPLHVVFLASWMPFPHGMAASNRLGLLARSLHDAGAHAHVLCMQASDRPPHVENRRVKGVHRGVSFEYSAGTTVRHGSFVIRRLIEVRGWTAGAYRLCALRRQGRMDCAYVWFTSQRWQVRRAVYVGLLRALRVPVVIELNERPWPLRADKRLIERSRSPLDGVAGAVAISQYLMDWARQEAQRLGRSLQLIEVPILVDVDEQVPRDYSLGRPSVLFAGSPVYDETIAFILEAMRTVWDRHPDCRLVITGAKPSDPAARWLTARASQGHVDDRVTIAGYVSRAELVQLYADSHALLVPLFDDVRSRARFPTKLGEYLASARPVVTTSVGEMARYLTDGEDGFLSPPGVPISYGLKVCEVLDDRDRARRIGMAGRELARRRFHYTVHGPRLLEALAAACCPEGTMPAGGSGGVRRLQQ